MERSERHDWGPAERDAALRRTRRLTRALAVAAVSLAGAFSAVAAQAFKGRVAVRKPVAAVPAPAAPAASRSRVPAPQYVPRIASRRRLEPPATPPSGAGDGSAAASQGPVPPPGAPSAAPVQAPPPAPVVSGGS